MLIILFTCITTSSYRSLHLASYILHHHIILQEPARQPRMQGGEQGSPKVSGASVQSDLVVRTLDQCASSKMHTSAYQCISVHTSVLHPKCTWKWANCKSCDNDADHIGWRQKRQQGQVLTDQTKLDGDNFLKSCNDLVPLINSKRQTKPKWMDKTKFKTPSEKGSPLRQQCL